MDSSFFDSFLTIENIRDILESYRSMGPFIGVLLPLLESFFPLLPLLLFVATNAAVYGFWFGAFLSWCGTCLGGIIVFGVFRYLAKGRLKRWLGKSRKITRTLQWVEQHGFGPLFLLYCIPFTPSSLVNVASGLSGLSFRTYLISLLLGKMVMIFMVSYVGYDWLNMIHQPLKMLLVAVIVVMLWIVGKRMEMRMQQPKKLKESK